jgi:hypothetical protein
MKQIQCAWVVSLFGLASVVIASSASAALSKVDIGKNYQYGQTASGVTLTGTFFSARAFLDNAADFDTGSVSYPGAASPQALTHYPVNTPYPNAYLGYQTGYLSPSTIDSTYGFGNYTITAINSTTSAVQTVNIAYTQDAYTSDIPALDAASFAALSTADSSQPLMLHFNAFAPAAAADTALFYFDVTDLADDAVVFTDYARPPSTTSELLPGGTLLPGHSYAYQLIFDDRISAVDPSSNVPTEQFFDVRTVGYFTAAVPEPATWTMFAAGFGLLVGKLKRRGRFA